MIPAFNEMQWLGVDVCVVVQTLALSKNALICSQLQQLMKLLFELLAIAVSP
jgi:hypothetical protein